MTDKLLTNPSKLTIRIHWHYKDESGIASMDVSGPEPNRNKADYLEGLIFWFTEGNMGCDCSRLEVIGKITSDEHVQCGEDVIFTHGRIDGMSTSLVFDGLEKCNCPILPLDVYDN